MSESLLKEWTFKAIRTSSLLLQLKLPCYRLSNHTKKTWVSIWVPLSWATGKRTQWILQSHTGWTCTRTGLKVLKQKTNTNVARLNPWSATRAIWWSKSDIKSVGLTTSSTPKSWISRLKTSLRARKKKDLRLLQITIRLMKLKLLVKTTFSLLSPARNKNKSLCSQCDLSLFSTEPEYTQTSTQSPYKKWPEKTRNFFTSNLAAIKYSPKRVTRKLSFGSLVIALTKT